MGERRKIATPKMREERGKKERREVITSQNWTQRINGRSRNSKQKIDTQNSTKGSYLSLRIAHPLIHGYYF